MFLLEGSDKAGDDVSSVSSSGHDLEKSFDSGDQKKSPGISSLNKADEVVKETILKSSQSAQAPIIPPKPTGVEISGFKYQRKNINGEDEFKIIGVRKDAINDLIDGKILNASDKNKYKEDFIEDPNLLIPFNELIKDEQQLRDKLGSNFSQNATILQKTATFCEFQRRCKEDLDTRSDPSNIQELFSAVAKDMKMHLHFIPSSAEDLGRIGKILGNEYDEWSKEIDKLHSTKGEALGSFTYTTGVLLPEGAIAAAEVSGMFFCAFGAALPLMIGGAALVLLLNEFNKQITDKLEETIDPPERDFLKEDTTKKIDPALVGGKEGVDPALAYALEDITSETRQGLAQVGSSSESPKEISSKSTPPQTSQKGGDSHSF